MNTIAKCKLCGKPLVLTVDDDYAAMGDPQKLIRLATCNGCYDAFDKRSRAEAQIFRGCRALAMQPKMNSETRSRIRAGLLASTKNYALSIAILFKAEQYLWDEEFTNLLMEQPHKAGIILSKYRNDVKAYSRQPKSNPEQLPYTD